MRNIVFALLFAIIGFSSCSKDSDIIYASTKEYSYVLNTRINGKIYAYLYPVSSNCEYQQYVFKIDIRTDNDKYLVISTYGDKETLVSNLVEHLENFKHYVSKHLDFYGDEYYAFNYPGYNNSYWDTNVTLSIIFPPYDMKHYVWDLKRIMTSL